MVMRRRRGVGHALRLALVATVVLAVVPVVTTPPASALAPKTKQRVEAPIRLAPLERNEPIQVEGLGGYLGTLAIDSRSDGLVLVDRLPLERYLLGLDEVPPEWPREALRAQAIAARTYALRTLGRPPTGAAATYGFDICASISCQVFSGADVLSSPSGSRWADAVADTERKAILFGGEPILARYHSISGGRTLDNSDAFPGEADYPYLRSVTSTTEEDSPLYRWRADFALDDLGRILRAAGLWGGRRLSEVHTAPPSGGRVYPDVILRGKDKRVRIDAEELRSAVRERAPKMFPLLYPSPAATSTGRLPETLPSNRIDIATEDDVAEVRGRGWGHGVGMSQWGAHGLAEEGAGYEEILTHYYSGVTVREVDGVGNIDVGLDWARRSIEVSGDFRIEDASGGTVVARAHGAWRFVAGDDGSIVLGEGEVGEVGADTLGDGVALEVAILEAPGTVEAGSSARLLVSLSRPAELQAVIDTGEEETRSPPVLRASSRSGVPWWAPDEPGSYRVVVTADAGDVAASSEVVVIEVVERAPEAAASPGLDETGGEDASSRLPIFLVAAALVAAALAVTMRWWPRRRRSKIRSETPSS